MKKRIAAAFVASVVSALLLAGCATNPGVGAANLPDVDLNDPTSVAALCDAEAQEVLDIVTTAAEAKENSGKRNVVTRMGLTSAEAKDEAKLEEVKAALKTRAEASCDEAPGNDGTVGIQNADGTSTFNLPLVAGTDATLVVDTTTQAATPPLLDGTLRFTAQTLTWEGLVERVGHQQWYIDGVNARAAQTGFTWDDVLKFASVNRIEDGKVDNSGVNALAIQIFNRPDLTDEQARDMVREYITPEVEETIGLTVEQLPIQRINNGFVNTRNVGSTTYPAMGDYFDTQKMVRVSLMPIKFDAQGQPVSLDGSRGAGIFIDCGNLHWVPPAVWVCKTDSCEKPPPPPAPKCPWNHNIPPNHPDCLQPKGNRTPPNEWTPLGPGTLTDGQETQRQRDNGDVSGNVIDNPVSGNTESGDTTPDLPTGTVTAPGAETGGSDRTDDVDLGDEVTNDDDGGTEGDGCIVNPLTGANECD